MPNMPKKSGFTLIELLIVIVIIGILATIGLASFSSSQMKSRDAKRKANLQQISQALELYYNDYGQYPVSSNGVIMGCVDGTSACIWGSLTKPFANSKTTYMITLPADPSSNSYYYVATKAPASQLYTKYQLYAHLENTQDKNILPSATGLDCGTGADSCNFGISSGNTKP